MLPRSREQRAKDRRPPSPRRVRAFRTRILAWYAANGREFPWRAADASHYEHVISEVLLQRTRAEAVAAFFPSFVRKFRSWNQLSQASESELGSFLRPIGLWRRRAASLQLLARAMTLRRGRFPKSREEIAQLPGVGQYIANAIEAACWCRPKPLLDVNMARVLERYFGPRALADIRYDPYLQSLAHEVVRCEHPLTASWSVLDLAAAICTPRKPNCPRCPLSGSCNYARGISKGRDD